MVRLRSSDQTWLPLLTSHKNKGSTKQYRKWSIWPSGIRTSNKQCTTSISKPKSGGTCLFQRTQNQAMTPRSSNTVWIWAGSFPLLRQTTTLEELLSCAKLSKLWSGPRKPTKSLGLPTSCFRTKPCLKIIKEGKYSLKTNWSHKCSNRCILCGRPICNYRAISKFKLIIQTR